LNEARVAAIESSRRGAFREYRPAVIARERSDEAIQTKLWRPLSVLVVETYAKQFVPGFAGGLVWIASPLRQGE